MRVHFRAPSRRRSIGLVVLVVATLGVAGPLAGAGAGVAAAVAVAVEPSDAEPGAGVAPTSDPGEPGDPGESGTGPTVWRIAGGDRYEEAVQISLRTNPRGASTVYISSGTAFADALSAGPAAVLNQAPLLLVPPGTLPPVVAGEISRLNPSRIVVVGGVASVPDSVVAQLRTVAPRAGFTRLAGADRYEVSRAVVADAFPGTSDLAYVATGRDFPDALSAGASAAALSAPVVLVDGSAPTADLATTDLLHRLSIKGAVLVGGPASISAGMDGAISSIAYPFRIVGADRYQVSIALNQAFAVDYSTVYLATGAAFPDALAGGVLAGRERMPLYVVPSNCVPKAVLNAISDHGTTKVVLLGGPASLGDAVAALTPCSW